MSLTHALLGVLDSRPMNGYELAKFFTSTAQWVWSAPQSQIYTTLRRMHADGLIVGDTQERATRMKSTVYTLTDKGRGELKEWLRTPRTLSPSRDAFLVQALFLDVVDDADAVKVLEDFIGQNEQMVRRWSEHRDLLLMHSTPLLRERLASRPKAEHTRIAALKAHVFQAEIDRATAMIKWAERALEIVADPH